MVGKMPCVYCSSPEIQNREIVRNKLARAFPSNRAIGPCHVLITPLRCVPTWDELTSEEQEAIFDLRDTLKPVLQEVFAAEGFNYAWNEGEVAGQSIPHFHLHVIPRKAGDTGITGYDPRQFLYRPEKWEEISEIALKKVTKRLKQAVHTRENK